jgi:rubrerythrin
VTSLEPAVRAALERALADERKAEAMYRQVVEDLGAARPFAHTAHAESRHAAALTAAFRRRGETPPEPSAAAEPPPHAATVAEACAIAAKWEEENVALYDELLRGELPTDVRRVFEHNRAASLDHHLPMFRRCAGTSAR